MINSELFVEIKAIVLRKIQQQFKEAHFYEHPVFGLCSVIEENINWQHSVAQMFLREVYGKLQKFHIIQDNGIPYGIEDCHQCVYPELFAEDSKKVLQALEDSEDILKFLMTRCLFSFHGRPIDNYQDLIGK